MPVLRDSDYRPPLLLKNRHLLTVYPTLFRRMSALRYSRTRIATPDDDFLDLDFSLTGSDRIVIILHGLEGHAGRKYVLGMVNVFNQGGYDTVSLNFRGCSGEPNRNLRFYHSGDTGDLAHVVEYLVRSKPYKDIHLVGFSVGGNVLLKYLGEKGANIPAQIRSAVAISVPCDLKSSAIQLESVQNAIYMKRFIRDLGHKLELKARRFPDNINLENYRAVKTFRQFDDRYTAPLHGFQDAEQYWKLSSSKQYLPKIKVPVLLINALDDPFLTKECFPYEEAAGNDRLYLETPRYGGHVGFVRLGNREYWSERRAFEFIHGATA
jgi:predicted alpha/beta-fold hydrolase